MKKYISPSMMCVDFMNVKDYIKIFEEEKIDYLHIDIMDGEFVPNYTLGTDFCKAMKKNTNIPLDIHLMINEPEKKLDWIEFGENDIVSIHAESTKHICRALQFVKNRGAKAFIAINPGTPLSVCEPVSDIIDGILIMTVNPGFAGGKLVEFTLKKIQEAKNFAKDIGREDILIEVDGNVSFENAIKMRDAGADIYIVGSSSIFKKDISMHDAIKKFRKIICA